MCVFHHFSLKNIENKKMLGLLLPHPPLPFLLFLLNGLGEVATGLQWLVAPEAQIERGGIGPHVAFLFRAWAVSIIGFGAASLSIALSSQEGSYECDGTRAFALGATVYHAAIAGLYLHGLRQGVLRPIVAWWIGTILHLTALAFFVAL